ncbi:hypothetical protein [Halobacillus sp. Marseille-Q1614]|uniref:hypothetical protein n=1 Tax=Halobacillus sp. Marseille-Q1614 TaxID=2709134 RepID=UPI00156FD84D|nr:hypothetical protein [Halobacillus sp. Marseille-Q1614]
MNRKEIDERVIQQYIKDEETMIFIFAQWCINNDLDPELLYEKAYPHQGRNPKLKKALEQTISKKESESISDAALIEVLSVFGNDDLAFTVAEYLNG